MPPNWCDSRPSGRRNFRSSFEFNHGGHGGGTKSGGRLEANRRVCHGRFCADCRTLDLKRLSVLSKEPAVRLPTALLRSAILHQASARGREATPRVPSIAYSRSDILRREPSTVNV